MITYPDQSRQHLFKWIFPLIGMKYCLQNERLSMILHDDRSLHLSFSRARRRSNIYAVEKTYTSSVRYRSVTKEILTDRYSLCSIFSLLLSVHLTTWIQISLSPNQWFFFHYMYAATVIFKIVDHYVNPWLWHFNVIGVSMRDKIRVTCKWDYSNLYYILMIQN